MDDLEKLMQNNRQWAEKRTAEDPAYFAEMAKSQSPKYLWIGCSDSRIPATEILGLGPGDLFVHRNVANLCLGSDLSFLSALQFSVEHLKIEHVIVCGHYKCGGVMASMQKPQLGLMEEWINQIRGVYDLNREELDAIADQEKRSERLSELNVRAQVRNVSETAVVQGAWKRGQKLAVHGWIYDLAKGRVNDLGCSVTQ